MLYNAKIEQNTIGLLLLYPDLYSKHILTEDMFFTELGIKAFKAIRDLSNSGQDFSNLNILDFSPSDYVMTAINDAISKSHYDGCIKELRKFATYRKIVQDTQKIAQLANNGKTIDIIKQIESLQIDVISSIGDEKDVTTKGVLQRLESFRKDYINNSGAIIKTGIPILDRLTKGIFPQTSWTIGAPSSAGKTIFCLQLLLQALKQKKKCLLFSLEMSDIMNMARLISHLSRVSAIDILLGENTEEISKAIAWLEKQPLTIYDNKFTLADIRTLTKKHNANNGIDLVIVDYVQLIDGDEKLYERMSRAGQAMSRIAKENNCALIIASQLSNEEAMKSRRSGHLAFKGAGELANATDVGILLERLVDDNDNIVENRLRCRIGKNRYGQRAKFYLKLDPIYGCFSEDSDQEDPF